MHDVTTVHRIDRLHEGAGESYAHAGIDEVGVDSIAGPMVAAVVVLRPDHGVIGLPRDSKELEDKTIQAMAALIEPAVRFAWIGSLDAEAVDQLGVHEARTRLWQAAAAEVRRALPSVPIIIDGGEAIPGVNNQTAIPQSDATHDAVSAGAILAKSYCDRIMIAFDTTYPGYLFARHKGYAKRDHLIALQRLGPSPVHRHMRTQKEMAKPIPEEVLDLPMTELRAMLEPVAPLLEAHPDSFGEWASNFLRDQCRRVLTRGLVPSGRQQFFIKKCCKEIMKAARKKGLVPASAVPAPPVHESGRISRNRPCPCGSGRIYKWCCAEDAVAKRALDPPPSQRR